MKVIAELQKLRESEDHIEFKEAKKNFPFAGGGHSDPKDRRHCLLGYMVALANEHGGQLALGLKDKMPHEVVGSDFALGTVGELVDEIYKRLGIRVEAEELYDNDKRVLLLTVPSRPIGRPLKFEGVYLMRTGESLREMSDAELYRILAEQEPDFSAQICEGLTVEDLDPSAISAMKVRYAEKHENSTLQSSPDIQILTDLKLLNGGRLNYAALILLGKSDAIRQYLPQDEIVVEFRMYHSMIEYTCRQSFQLPLFIAVDEVWKYINQPASNPQLHYSDGPYIFDIPSFNEEVIREAILNACCHRSMRIKSSVFIKQYPDSLTITNAGGFPPGVDANNILTVSSTPRCKLMSEIMEKTGLVERSGQGVDKMFYISMMEGKALPDYSGTDLYQVSLTFNAPILDASFVRFIRHEQLRRDKDNKLNVFELYTLYKVALLDFTDIDHSIAAKLCKKGLMKIKDGYYRLTGSYKSPLNDKLKSFNLRHLQMVEECFNENTYISHTLLKEKFINVLSEKQIKTLLSKMHNSGFIGKYGSGRFIQYSKSPTFPSIKGNPIASETCE